MIEIVTPDSNLVSQAVAVGSDSMHVARRPVQRKMNQDMGILINSALLSKGLYRRFPVKSLSPFAVVSWNDQQIGTTMKHKRAHLSPVWNQVFSFNTGNGGTLKIQIFAIHVVHATLCGQVEVRLADLEDHLGEAMPLELFKDGENMGTVFVMINEAGSFFSPSMMLNDADSRDVLRRRWNDALNESRREALILPEISALQDSSSEYSPVADKPRTLDTDSISATLEVDIRRIKGTYCKRPFVSLGCEGREERTRTVTAIGGSADWEPNECRYTFALSDPQGDLFLYLYDEADHKFAKKGKKPVGRLIIPLATFLDPRDIFRKPPSQSKVMFAQFYPTNLLGKYRGALPKRPGTGMIKSKDPLGYLSFSLKLTQHRPTINNLMRIPWTPALVDDDDDDDDDLRNPMKDFTTKIKRHKQRIRLLLQLPVLVGYFWPRSYIMLLLDVVLCWFACYCLQAWHCPLLFFMLTVLNGYLSRLQVDSALPETVILWSDEVAKPDSLRVKYKRYTRIFGKTDLKLGLILSAIERSINIWNWSDPSLTLIALSVLGTICAVLSFSLKFQHFRTILFVVNCIILFVLFKKATSKKKGKVDWRKPRLSNLMRRVPDFYELSHRYIATTQFNLGRGHVTPTHPKLMNTPTRTAPEQKSPVPTVNKTLLSYPVLAPGEATKAEIVNRPHIVSLDPETQDDESSPVSPEKRRRAAFRRIKTHLSHKRKVDL